MIDNLEIKKASTGDLPHILKLYAQIDNKDVLSIDDAIRIFDKLKTYPNYSLYVAKIIDNVIGTFELLIMDNLAHKGCPSGVVEDVVVDENYRSMGIGKIMMEFAKDICQKNGCYKLTLSSNINRDRAHKFYESLGFVKHGYSFTIKI